MDNQQERLHFDMGYLLGMIDGEGSCLLEEKYRKNNTFNLIPRIVITNSNPDIFGFLIRIMKNLELPFHIWESRPTTNRRILNQIRIVGIKRIKRMTDLLLNYPSGKYEQLKILNDWCNYRLSIPQKAKDNGWTTTYGETDRNFKRKLHELHIKGAKSSETIRSDATA